MDPDAPWAVNLLVTVLVALIAAGGSAWVMWMTQRGTKKDVAVIKDQVKNTHETNLREDMDALHEKMDENGRHVLALREDVSAVRENAVADRRASDATGREVHALKLRLDAHLNGSD